MTLKNEPIDIIKGTREIARILGLDQATVLKLIHRGELPAFTIGGTLFTRRATLDAWLAAKEREAIAHQHAANARSKGEPGNAVDIAFQTWAAWCDLGLEGPHDPDTKIDLSDDLTKLRDLVHGLAMLHPNYEMHEAAWKLRQ